MSMIGGGHRSLVITNDGTFTQQVTPSEGLSQAAFEKLTKAVALGAFHNSGERFDPPKCHPRTRLAVTERIMNWILGKESTNELIMWLHGPAGAGKSAIAQRIAELCHEADRLLASFFFSKSDSRRNRADLLFPTIAYQIACAFPRARALIEQEITRDPLIFTRSLESQMVGLIVNPMQPLIDSDFFSDPTSSRHLIILDGLDEVADRQEQTRILKTISTILQRNQIPLIFLISSRPEQEISYEFNAQPLIRLTSRLLLDDTFHPDKDIRIFLDDSFSDIKAKHPQKKHIPPSWPSSDSLDHLVGKSSGQFIYASTAIHFVRSLRHRPVERLEVVLGLRPVHRDLPFAELDALYIHILSGIEHPNQALQIIGAILVQGYDLNNTMSTICLLEDFLGLESGDVEFYLVDAASLISFDSGTGAIRLLHASLGDFLFDASRSGAFTIDRQATETMMACHCLRHLIFASDPNLPKEYWKNQLPMYSIYNTRWHLINSIPTIELKLFLGKLSFECLVENVRVNLPDPPQTRSLFGLPLLSNAQLFCEQLWPTIFHFVDLIQDLGLDQSEYHTLRDRNFDKVIKKELELQSLCHPSLQFFLCLRLRTRNFKNKFKGRVLFRWSTATKQLTDWDAADKEIVFGFMDWLYGLSENQDALKFYGFVRDASRAGEYAVNSETYACASLSCLKYLSRSCLGVPIYIHHTRRSLARRQNSPWHWKQNLIKPDYSQLILNYRGYYASGSPMTLSQEFWRFRKRAQRREMYMNSTYLALVFICRALPRSAKSDELVAFINSEKPFSQRALQFPAKLKKCKDAIATYFERVQSDAADA